MYLLSSSNSSNVVQNMGLAARGLAERCCPPLFIPLSCFSSRKSMGLTASIIVEERTLAKLLSIRGRQAPRSRLFHGIGSTWCCCLPQPRVFWCYRESSGPALGAPWLPRHIEPSGCPQCGAQKTT